MFNAININKQLVNNSPSHFRGGIAPQRQNMLFTPPRPTVPQANTSPQSPQMFPATGLLAALRARRARLLNQQPEWQMRNLDYYRGGMYR